MEDDDPTVFIPRLTRGQRRRASRRQLPVGWLVYALAVVAVIVGAALLAVRG
jgi:hypothetical protein